MANEPLINRKSRVFFRPAASGGTGAWSDKSAAFYKFNLQLKVASIDTPNFTTVGHDTEKGDPEHMVDIGVNHSRAWSELSALLATELLAEGDTEFLFKSRGAVATSADNPYFWIKVKWIDLGNIGGAKNELAKVEVSLKIEGQVLRSITAGDPPADGSFSVYV